MRYNYYIRLKEVITLRYRKAYKTEIHIHLEQEKTSLTREVTVAIISAIAGALITKLLG